MAGPGANFDNDLITFERNVFSHKAISHVVREKPHGILLTLYRENIFRGTKLAYLYSGNWSGINQFSEDLRMPVRHRPNVGQRHVVRKYTTLTNKKSSDKFLIQLFFQRN